MASPPISELFFLDETGLPDAAPIEWAPGLVVVPVDFGLLTQVEVRRNGEPLEVLARVIGDHVCVAGAWPRSPAGTYHVTAQTADGNWSATATWFVEPQKLTMAAVDAMLDELQRLPASIAIGLQQGGALAGMDLIAPQDATLAEELERLRRAVQGTVARPGLSAVLRIAAENPYAVLRSLEVWTPTDRARRVHPTGLRRAYQHAGNLGPDNRPLRVPEMRVRHSVDVYENRLLRAFHEQVDARLRPIIQQSGVASVVSAAEELLRDLTHARRAASFLDDVGHLTESPSRLTMVLLKRAEYRAALEGFLEFRRSAVVHLQDGALLAPFENIPHLYETWGTLEVINALLAIAVEEGWVVKRQRLVTFHPGKTWVTILADRTAVELEQPASGRTIRLKPQRSYGIGAGALHSVSFRQIPDVAVEVTEPGGEIAVLIYDPKYKLHGDETSAATSLAGGKPKKEDIDTMHSYRDSIRDAKERHIVRFAAILYPGQSVTYEPGLAAISAQPAAPGALRAALHDTLRAAIHLHAAPSAAKPL